MVTVVDRNVFHITLFADGSVTILDNDQGSFYFVPNDQSAPTSSGHYRNGFSDTFRTNFDEAFTATFLAVGRDANGAQLKFKVTSHYTFANGEVRVDKTTVSCG